MPLHAEFGGAMHQFDLYSSDNQFVLFMYSGLCSATHFSLLFLRTLLFTMTMS